MAEVDPTGNAINKKATLYGGMSQIAVMGSSVVWPLPRHLWRDEVQDSYEAYKNDVSSRVARQVDVSMVYRYFDLQEAMARVFDELMESETFLVVNQQGGQTSHPHLSTFSRLLGMSIRLANEIGATPMARVKLGLYATEGAVAQAALERAVNADPIARHAAGHVIEAELVGDEIVMKW